MSTDTLAPGTKVEFVHKAKGLFLLVQGTVTAAPDQYGYVTLGDCAKVAGADSRTTPRRVVIHQSEVRPVDVA